MITHKGWNSSAQFGGYQEVAQTVKCLPAMWKTKVRSLDWEDPLEKEMETHCSTLAWQIPWAEEPCRLQSMGPQSWTRLSDFTSLKLKQDHQGRC